MASYTTPSSWLLLLVCLIFTLCACSAKSPQAKPETSPALSSSPQQDAVGGGVRDVYRGLVIMAVQPNWSTTFSTRQNYTATVRVKLDREGTVLECYIEESSGNPSFDGTTLNAIKRTKIFPRPPSPELQELIMVFNSQEL